MDVGHESDISAERYVFEGNLGGRVLIDLGSDTESTASITSSIFENHYFQGRSYANPKYGKHW